VFKQKTVDYMNRLIKKYRLVFVQKVSNPASRWLQSQTQVIVTQAINQQTSFLPKFFY
jgi:hypothetical protein